MIQKEYPFLGDCLISESSWDGFHCIFDSKVTWAQIMRVCRALTHIGIVNRNYIAVRTFREDLTVRVSSIDRGLEKSEAPKPIALVFAKNGSYGYNDRFSGIANYLDVLSAFRDLSQPEYQLL
jgi:hypothetical protein